MPTRRQTIILTNARIVLIVPLETNCSEILIWIHIFSSKNLKMHLKMSGKWRPFASVSMYQRQLLGEMPHLRNNEMFYVTCINDISFLFTHERARYLYSHICSRHITSWEWEILSSDRGSSPVLCMLDKWVGQWEKLNICKASSRCFWSCSETERKRTLEA